MYQMGHHPQNKKGWPKLPQVLQGASGGRQNRRFLWKHGFYGTRVAGQHFEWGKSSEIQTSFYFVGIYTPTPLENNQLLEPQSDGLKAHLSLQGQPTTCALPTSLVFSKHSSTSSNFQNNQIYPKLRLASSILALVCTKIIEKHSQWTSAAVS